MNPDIQYFASSGTWVKPPGAIRVDYLTCAAGAGGSVGIGQAGRDGGNGELRCGSLDAGELPEQVDVTIGRGGRGAVLGPFKGGDGADGYALIVTHLNGEVKDYPQMPVKDSARCLVDLVHADTSKARCVLGLDHLEQEADHLDEHGHYAPCLRVSQAIAAAEALRAEAEDNTPLLVQRPRNRAAEAARDAAECIGLGRIEDARSLLAEASRELDTAERRAGEAAAR